MSSHRTPAVLIPWCLALALPVAAQDGRDMAPSYNTVPPPTAANVSRGATTPNVSYQEMLRRMEAAGDQARAERRYRESGVPPRTVDRRPVQRQGAYVNPPNWSENPVDPPSAGRPYESRRPVAPTTADRYAGPPPNNRPISSPRGGSIADRFGAPDSVDLPRRTTARPRYQSVSEPWSPPDPRYGPPAVPTSRPSWSPDAGPVLDPRDYGPADPIRPDRSQWHSPPWNPDNVGCDDGSCRHAGCTCDGCGCDGGGSLCDALFATCGCEPWTWQYLPSGILFRSYLAGPKETRLGVSWNRRNGNGDEWIMDGTIGGKIGLFRYGTRGPLNAEGYQIDFESAALLRMNWTQDLDMDGTDFRFGIPLTYRKGRWEWRFGYYHLSAHTGDEFLVRNMTLTRENYIRDSLVLGLAYFVTEDLRVYGEVDGAFHERAGADAWHFQFGFDYSPIVRGPEGAPFLAVNGLLREEVNYGGGLNVMAGWQWMPVDRDGVIRVGLRYYNGESTQYSFFDEHEELIGAGLWYDY